MIAENSSPAWRFGRYCFSVGMNSLGEKKFFAGVNTVYHFLRGGQPACPI
jgi:hypothetical protein